MPPHGRKRAKCSVALQKQTAETFKKSPVTRAVVVQRGGKITTSFCPITALLGILCK